MSRNASIGDDPILRLSRTLSTTSILLAPIHGQQAVAGATFEGGSTQRYRKIGEGGCGIIFEHTDASLVLKKARNRRDGALWNDYAMQTKVHAEFARAQYLFDQHRPPCTTRPMYFISPENRQWWAENVRKFPTDYQLPSHMPLLCSERIPSLSKEIKEDLIDVFCPEESREEVKSQIANLGCIARLYLGRRRRVSAGAQRFFSLRNFPLRLDMAEEIHLDISAYAAQMATGLALCHWRARVNANDVEFVLGGPPTALNIAPFITAQIEELPQDADTTPASMRDNPGSRTTQLWMLDYDKCRSMSMDNEGIKEAARAAEDNDPYFPKPHTGTAADQELWRMFKAAYLEASQTIMRVDEVQDEMWDFPTKFIWEWEDYRMVKVAKQNGIASEDTSEEISWR